MKTEECKRCKHDVSCERGEQMPEYCDFCVKALEKEDEALEEQLSHLCPPLPPDWR